MNKLIPFAKFSNNAKKLDFLSGMSIVVNDKKAPLGFVFGRDAFISLLEHIDEQFEEKVSDPKKAFDNPAGRLIDLIEEKLSVNPNFVKKLKKSVAAMNKSHWIPFKEVMRSLNV